MFLKQPSRGTLLAGIVGIALGGCGDSGAGDVGDMGTTSGAPTSGDAGTGETSSITASSTGTTLGATTNTTSPTTTTVTTASATTGNSSGTTGDTTTTASTAGSGGSDAGGTSGMTSSAGGATGSTTTTASGGTSTSGATSTTMGDIEGPCTESEPANSNASGSGPHDVTVETNGDPGINEGTIFRPTDLGGAERYPIFVWAQGACSQNGLSAASAMAEIASHGYFVVADGTPNGSGSRSQTNDVVSMAEPLIAYIDWVIDENHKPCSAYYQSIDTSKIAANGFSCGGLMSTGTAGDPRITTWGSTSSGTFSVNQALYDSVHTPVLIIEGGPSDIAYENGKRDYDNISPLGHPIMFFSKDIGHGGDLFQNGGGDFTKINLAWLNWWLKGDETATGKGLLVGAGCPYCSDPEWETMSANIP